MESIESIVKIMEMKSEYPNSSFFRNIRHNGADSYNEILNLVNLNELWTKEMHDEYFASDIVQICNKQTHYTPKLDSSMKDILLWGKSLCLEYSKELSLFVSYKEKYEKSLFGGDIDNAHKILNQIERKISFSVWGIQQRLLLFHLKNEKEEIDKVIKKVETITNNCASLLIFFHNKMTDSNIDYKKYLENIQNFLGSIDEDSTVWKYFDSKLNIATVKNIQAIKISLVIDEQISIIDYYETFIEALQLLYSRQNAGYIVCDIVRELIKHICDYRISNLVVACFEIDKVIVDDNICSIIEAYTCGRYKELHTLWEKCNDDIVCDFTMCNLFVKSGMKLSLYEGYFSNLWKEIEKIYNFEHETDISVEKLSGFYKLLNGTSWKYKVLGILTRKLNYNYNQDVIDISVLNDKWLTPLFYQCIKKHKNKIDYINKFTHVAPATCQLHLYMLTGNANTSYMRMIHPNRRKYYEIKHLFTNEAYSRCIKQAEILLNEMNDGSDFYYQERIRRILYGCYINTNKIINAMNLYIDSYILGKEQISHMKIASLIEKIEENEEVSVKKNICRPIITSMYYKNSSDGIISSYLDFLELHECNTIKDYIDGIDELDIYQTLFLWKVCTTNLLLKDYVSKTLVNGSAADLRALVLKKLISNGIGEKREYIAELNIIYKELQLKSRIDSFNHNRIFIDKENLINYLKDEIKKEFARYSVVQEIRNVIGENKIGIGDIEFLTENYWDQTRFFSNIVEKIKGEYLNESPYSLEDFLSTRIRHNYCNDKLKDVFEEEKLFSKKETDSSHEYIVNSYWESKLLPLQYDLVKDVLSQFSAKIDLKIQEIKAKWIRIRKDVRSDGMFDYLGFTYYFVNYSLLDFGMMLNDPEEFLKGVIKELDNYTNGILDNIRDRIETELKPYYYNAIIQLDDGIKSLDFNKDVKSEILRKIEITKARYVEDLEGFKDIFYMDNEKYPDFKFNDLIEFCCKVESEMNKEFSRNNVSIVNRCEEEYCGYIFPFMVDIMCILIRNAVQHSQFANLQNLKIDIVVESYIESSISKEFNLPFYERGVVINIKNNLDYSVNEEYIQNKVHTIIDNINRKKYREESSKEGGSGLYKIARTVEYNLCCPALMYHSECDGYFDMFFMIDLNKFVRRSLNEDSMHGRSN